MALPKLSVLALRDMHLRILTELEAHTSPLAQACAAKERRLELQVTSYPPHHSLPHLQHCNLADEWTAADIAGASSTWLRVTKK